MATIANRYFIKKGVEAFADITTKFSGVTILKIDNFLARGKAKNIYTQSWINSNTEDVYVPDTVFFENTDVNITFIVRGNSAITVHDTFIDYLTKNKTTIKSLYVNKQSDFVCLTEYEPTLTHLGRTNDDNYIMGTITLHRVTEISTPT